MELAVAGIVRAVAITAAVAWATAGCKAPARARATADDGTGSGPRHVDATCIGRSEVEARRCAIRSALAQLKPQFVDSLVAVRDDQLVEDRIRIFASQSNVVAQVIDRRVMPDGSIEVTMRVWVNPRGSPAPDGPSTAWRVGSPARRAASGVGEALDAEEENARDAEGTLADYIRDAAGASLCITLFHADGRPFEVQTLATGDIRKGPLGTVSVPVVVRVGRSAGDRSSRADVNVREALESAATRVVRGATELSARELTGCPLSGSEIWQGTTTARGLVQPRNGEGSVLLARRNDERADGINWLRFDQYLLPSEMVPTHLEVPSAVRIELHDAAGGIVASGRVRLAEARYLIDCGRLTQRLAVGSNATVEVGGRGAAEVRYPFLAWGTHRESGARGQHLAIHALALTRGTLAGGPTAFAEELEFWLEIPLAREALRSVVHWDAFIETSPVD